MSALVSARFARPARRFATTAITMLMALSLVGGPIATTAMGARANNGKGRGVPPPKNMVDINIDQVIVRDGQLVALGNIGGQAFERVLNLTTRANPADADCPILDLEIGAIHLNVLGLNVDTSDICLEITAHEGEGLLGDLLCGVANLLDDGLLDLGDILAGLTDDQLQALLDGLEDLLDDVFNQATKPAAIAGVSGTTPGACDILNLSLGPVDLNLLGLQVYLHDCEDGPVTIDITAVPGEGLLGDLLAGLLCDLDLLQGGGNPLKALLNRIADTIADLLATTA